MPESEPAVVARPERPWLTAGMVFFDRSSLYARPLSTDFCTASFTVLDALAMEPAVLEALAARAFIDLRFASALALLCESVAMAALTASRWSWVRLVSSATACK